MVEREAEALERRSGDGLVIGGRVAEEEQEEGGRQLRGEVGGGGGVVGAAALQVEQPRVRGGAVGLRRNLLHLPLHRRWLHEGGGDLGFCFWREGEVSRRSRAPGIWGVGKTVPGYANCRALSTPTRRESGIQN